MKKKKALVIILGLIAAVLYYYVTLPAINIHSQGFWMFLFSLVLILIALYGFDSLKRGINLRTDKRMKLGVTVVGAMAVVFLVGSLLSSPIVNAKKYQQLLPVQDREFTEDIKEISYNKIPILDKDSATLLGNRKMGSMIDMVSQFEVSDLYTQINYQDVPVRVTPLVYASTIKWLTNQSQGIPAYIKIDMTTQTTDCVKLAQGMKYSPAEHFNRNLNRHLRFKYPTYIFDAINFELDDDGTPYWSCSVKAFKIGLFGGQTVGRLVLCNAITGETTDYAIDEIPSWVDRAYSPELLISLYNYHGTLKHGYFNSILGQKDCLKTTDGYNYIALEDDVWIYTGVTSVSGDRSNVGFVLMNQRTQETRFYSITGAEEFSAMSSAEGQVQHLNYQATFPLLLNISNEPTYFIALKDAAGLVKKYAMVNVQQYQIVAIGDSVLECEKDYVSLLKSNNMLTSPDESTINTKTGTIKKIAQGVIEGNTHYYILFEDSNEIFDIAFVENLEVIRLNEGDMVTIEYVKGTDVNTVLSINP